MCFRRNSILAYGWKIVNKRDGKRRNNNPYGVVFYGQIRTHNNTNISYRMGLKRHRPCCLKTIAVHYVMIIMFRMNTW